MEAIATWGDGRCARSTDHAPVFRRARHERRQTRCGEDWDLYCATVVLVSDDDLFYSCGMHHFGLAECAVPRTLDPAEAADLMNRFNLWRIAEDPVFESGHTFSLDADAPRWRLALAEDTRHAVDEGIHNPDGVWALGAE